MSIEDLDTDELFQNDRAQRAHETRQAGRTAGVHERSSKRTRQGGFTITLRIKPDRRCLVIPVDPANERRRRP